MEVVHRSEGSIERKLQNVLAVLDVLGVQWIACDGGSGDQTSDARIRLQGSQGESGRR
jgi:hypothetical protein